MKLRMTSLALAGVLAAGLVLPAFAAQPEDSSAGQVTAPGIYVNGELADELEFQLYKGVNYITVESFLEAMNQETVVEATADTLSITATTAEVIDVEQPEVTDPSAPADGQEEGVPAQDGAEDGQTGGGTQTEDKTQAEDGAQTGDKAQTEDGTQADGETQAGDETQAEDGTPTGDQAPQETPEANVVEETLTLTVTADANWVVANGRYLYVKDAVIWLNGKLAVPVRVLAEIFNLDVGYDGATGNVTLTKQEGTDAYLMDGASYYNEDTLYWLSRIIYAESGNQPLLGKIAVGNVVMNRVASPLFPDNIYDVIFQRNQFSPASSGSIYRTPNTASVEAAKLVMDGAVVYGNALFFNRAGLSCYASRNRPYIGTIGGHSFYA